jgi:hypothetical protein
MQAKLDHYKPMPDSSNWAWPPKACGVRLWITGWFQAGLYRLWCPSQLTDAGKISPCHVIKIIMAMTSCYKCSRQDEGTICRKD